MQSDISLAVEGGARRLTYAELADVRRISVESAERLVRRRKWPRQLGNDGVVRIHVPLKEAQKSSPKPRRVRRGYPAPDIRGQSGETVRADIRLIERAIGELSAQLEHERQRADRAEQRADEAIARAEQRAHDAVARADRAEKRLDELLTDSRQPVPPAPTVPDSPSTSPPRRRWRWFRRG